MKINSRREAYTAYINSPHWHTLRLQKLKEHGRFCDHCKLNTSLHVHHIFYRNFTDCTTADLAVLCEACHDDFHMAAKCFRFEYAGVMVPEISLRINEFRTSPQRERIVTRRERKLERRRNTRNERRAHKDTKRRIRKAYHKMTNAHCSDESIRTMIATLCEILGDKVPQLPPRAPVVDVPVMTPPKPPKLKTKELPPALSESDLEAMKVKQLLHRRSCALCGSKDSLRAFSIRPNTMQLSRDDLRTICGKCALIAESREATDYLAAKPCNTSASLFAHLQVIFKRISGIPMGEPIPRTTP